IIDSGIGMAAEDIDRANELIASSNAQTLAPSRYLGHYVVAQLAARHGLSVHLAASPTGGVTARIALPRRFGGGRPPPGRAGAAAEAEPVASDDPERPVAALPRRGSAAPEQEPRDDEPDESEPIVLDDTPIAPVIALASATAAALTHDDEPHVEAHVEAEPE